MLQEPVENAAPFISNVLQTCVEVPSELVATQPAQAPRDDDSLLDDFPASYRVDQVEIQVARPESHFYSKELDLQRLHRVMSWLWLCGQTAPPRPLHHQLLLGRRVAITERMDLHLVWGNGRIFVKPLPRWLIQRRFWAGNGLDESEPMSSRPGPGSIRTPRSSALGFLLSYVALIQYESDYHLAREARLIPGELAWKQWKVLVREILQRPVAGHHTQVADRFIYGELRLHRLDLIYQCLGLSVKGYLSRWDSYNSFIQSNLHLVVAGTVYLALALGALQVGLSTTGLQGNGSFQAAAYGATVLAMLGPLVAVGLVLIFAMLNFIHNWVWNRQNEKEREKMLGRRWRP